MAETPRQDDWTEERVARWLSQADALDQQLSAVTELLFAGAALQPAERVLDVGCGSGPTTRVAAQAVGPDGWVGGLDVAGGMLQAAAQVAVPDGAAPIEWIEADASTWAADIDAVDAVISRFGVMFFSDPAAAFTNLARATKPGGRLCTMVWDRRDRTEMFQVPFEATVRALTEAGREVPDLAVDEGAFSLSDAGAVRDLLTGAGWSDVTSEVHSVRLPVGGGQAIRGAAEAVVGIGPARVLTTGLEPDLVERVVQAIEAAFHDHLNEDGHVEMGGSVVRIAARRP